MPTWLIPHPDSVAPAVKIRVGVGRMPGGDVLLSYRVVGEIERLVWHDAAVDGRFDELWRHGCFEAFVAIDGLGYIELNMAPARRWASYRFDEYRAGMRDADAVPLRQDWLQRPSAVPRLELHARWKLPDGFADADCRLALSAVIEETDGTKSYWALVHAPGPPDFHNPACFVATLPAPPYP